MLSSLYSLVTVNPEEKRDRRNSIFKESELSSENEVDNYEN